MRISTVSSALVLTLLPLIGVSAGTGVCDGQVNLSETYIGQGNNVKVQFATCPDTSFAEFKTPRSLDARQSNVCGATCDTNCFLPAGGGPDPNDCTVIADALLYDSQNIGALFEIPTGTNNTIVMTYHSCLSFFVNQDFSDLTYCRTDWAGVIDFVAPNCQATQNAHGGNCVATDQRWFIQVQHS